MRCYLFPVERGESWENPETAKIPEDMPNQKELLCFLNSLSSQEDLLAANWAIEQLPLLRLSSLGKVILVKYEDLVDQPISVVRRVCEAWDLEVDEARLANRSEKPSKTVHDSGMIGANGWKKRLSKTQIQRIEEVVTKFGVNIPQIWNEGNDS